MSTIIINDTEFEFENYNRNTTYTDKGIVSDAYISTIKNTNTLNDIQTLAQEQITSIKIKRDGEIIYELADLNAMIQSIDESYDGTRVNFNVHIYQIDV